MISNDIESLMFMEAVEKAGINGIVAAAATAAYWGTSTDVRNFFGNGTMPFYVLAGTAGVVGSLVGDGTHIIMKDTIPVSKKFNDQASVIFGAGINGLMFAGLLYALNEKVLTDVGVLTALGVGAGAEVAGSAMYTYLKENSYF